ncbi:MAG: NifB/NifX family molybdenum-iron cluster-binding protein [Clostridiaceae bacterium]|nr:NifB/NifX family molybdenum-iron cluster-binding protein [Clostridiaceae bacterium]
MKLILPTESRSLDVPVCPSFGRTPLYASFDTESESCAYLDNSAIASEGGAGIKAAQMLADHGAGAVITYRCGENAAQVLHAANIGIYRAQDGTIAENIEKFRRGALQPLAEIHPGFHGHGGNPG